MMCLIGWPREGRGMIGTELPWSVGCGVMVIYQCNIGKAMRIIAERSRRYLLGVYMRGCTHM